MSFGGSGGGSGSIAGSADVTLSNPSDSQVLTYDGSTSKWKNANSSGGGSSPTYANLPAGSTITVYDNSGSWPSRPTSRTDITVIWTASSTSTPLPTGGVSGVDKLEKPAA